jgi:signal transduction histidine kinase
MKLATRMTLFIGACGVLLFGGSGVLQLQGEARDLRRVAQNETTLLCRSLQTEFAYALRDRQVEDISDTLEELTQLSPRISIFVYNSAGRIVEVSQGATPSAETLRIQQRVRASTAPVVEFYMQNSPPILRIGMRLREEAGGNPSVIILEKRLLEMQRDLDATRRTVWITTVSFVLAIASLAWILARRYVGTPLAQMVANMKKVRAGDLHIAQAAKSSDEVGTALAEFELLVRDLVEARLRADQEAEARLRMEQGLQHADKLVTLGQLSAVMAHEIGSPLQILEGRARALRKHADDADATRRTADMLVEQAERITKIVGQMLSITRRRAPVRALINVEQSIKTVVELLELEARRKSVRLMVEQSGPTEVFADADQLQQVALNLIRNALDAAPRNTVIVVSLSGDERTFVLSVKDQGPGLRESIRAHVFEPFFTTKADTGGSGLGLSVVKSIVQEHGGQVEFVSHAEQGCLVRVTLPRNLEAAR